MSSEVQELKAKVDELERTIKVLTAEAQKRSESKPINKDGLPVGLEIYADVENVGEVWLKTNRIDYEVIKIDNQRITHGKRFKSLSASAEFFSKIKRKSGWVYWRTEEGRTLKDAYKG